jgi:uncharacterized protein YegL
MNDMMENFGDLEFAQNSDPRIPVVLLLDCSDSMMEKRPGEDRSPFEALNGGLDTLWSALHSDPLAKRRAEVSFITFGSDVSEPTEFKTVDDMVLPALQPMGVTSLAEALTVALDAIEARKQTYRDNGVQYYRPILMAISDGLPTSPKETISEVSARLKDSVERKKLTFMPIAVEGADVDVMTSLSGKQALKLQGMKFDELFQWLSASAAAVSASQPGDAVKAPAPDGWAEL